MKLVTAIIRPERLPQVKEALFRAGITGMTISRVSGHGGEAVQVERYRGGQRLIEFHEKVQIVIAVSDEYVDRTVGAILGSASTGDVGDGKIFVQPLERTYRIRTGERDESALTPRAAAAR